MRSTTSWHSTAADQVTSPSESSGPDESRERGAHPPFGRAVRSVRKQQALTQEAPVERATLTAAESRLRRAGEREVGRSMAWRLADGPGVSHSGSS